MRARLYSRIVKSLSIEAKLAILIFFSHLETNLNSTYGHLAEKFKQEAEEQEVGRGGDNNGNKLNLPPLYAMFKYYRIITAIFQSISLLKYLLLLLSMDVKVLPLNLNCYLPGRITINVYLLEISRFMALYLLAMVIFWRVFSTTTSKGFELDLVLFLLHDKELVREESLKMGNMNHKLTYSGSHSNLDNFQNLLQRALFYKVHHGNLVLYRKRPNRTEWARKEITKLLDGLFYLPVIIILFFTFTAPSILHASSSDMGFIKIYPTCCSQLEALKPSNFWQLSLNHCWLRLLTVPLDCVDNFLLVSEFVLTVAPPTLIGILVTRDLLLEWEAIRPRIARLARHLRWQPERHYSLSGASTAPSMHQSSATKQLNLDLYMKDFGELGVDHETDTNELVSLLCDFFDSLGRANQFVGFYLSFLVAQFVGSIIIVGYASYLIPHYWNSIVLVMLCMGAYFTFLFASTVVLTLKSFLDASYVDICSIMALDKSASRRRKWMLILDNYTIRARNTYSLVTGTRFTWAFVLNCLATSISFLAALETLKSYWR